ncbi:hypothetical protein V1511DRAFT_457726 [Dipodascopsis uninucleata]
MNGHVIPASSQSSLPSNSKSKSYGHRSNRSCPPGPIPAAPPALVRRDEHGVEWIAFQYSKDRVRTEYCIRCDIDSVDVNMLSRSFRKDNCIYPRADVPEHQYLGNRHKYENECNRIGWALADLNPVLRGKRGLIQRAVDSWRNSNADPKVRSRRVRRLSKQSQYKQYQQQHQHQQVAHDSPNFGQINSSGSANTDFQMALNPFTPGLMTGSGPDSWKLMVGANDFKYEHVASNPTFIARTLSTSSASSSSSSSSFATQVPSRRTPVSCLESVSNLNNYTPIEQDSSLSSYSLSSYYPSFNSLSSFGSDISSEPKKGLKYVILDSDANDEAASRIRIRVTVDLVDLEQIPDKYRIDHAVYPRSIMASLSPHFQRPCPDSIMDSNKLEKEINEIGIKMAWLQPRVFEGRMQFLQRAIDAYRSKCASISGPNYELAPRKGRARWLARHHIPAMVQV